MGIVFNDGYKIYTCETFVASHFIPEKINIFAS